VVRSLTPWAIRAVAVLLFAGGIFTLTVRDQPPRHDRFQFTPMP
jgi:hypothetical protein